MLIHRSCYLVNVIKDPHSLFCRCVTINKHNNLHLLMKIITLFLSGVFYPPPFIIIKNPLFSLSENGLKQMLIHEKRSFHLIFIRIWQTCFRLERLLGRKYSNLPLPTKLGLPVDSATFNSRRYDGYARLVFV